jgi:NADPH:quinone reductase
MSGVTTVQLLSEIKSSGELNVWLADQTLAAPGPDQVIVRIDATPINPSDLGLLFGAGDMSAATASGTADRPVITAPVAPAGLRAMAGRLDEAMAVGNEGCGVVVQAGDSPAAQALLGKTVATLGGGMYAQHRLLNVRETMLLPDGTDAAAGASCFVNPLTALGMVETMRREGHSALVHTAAASNLGQMLNRICLKDGVGLVNIVRSAEQVKLLKDAGAVHVVDSSTETFLNDLTAALVATGATIAFDAIGGGKLGGQILTCMEAAAVQTMKTYSRYGSDTFKQLYIYGALDLSPTMLNRAFGFSWAVSGWLLTPFLQKIGMAEGQKLRDRVVAELHTTFASHYTSRVTLAEMLKPDVIAVYNRRATGEKVLICPNA